MIKRYLALSIALVTLGCKEPKDDSDVKTKASSNAAVKTSVEEILNSRPLCDSTLWTEDDKKKGQRKIIYECTLSDVQMQKFFNEMSNSWRTYNKQRIDELKKQLDRAGEIRRDSQHLYSKSLSALTKLHDAGLLIRYQNAVRGSPVEGKTLSNINDFFSSLAGEEYLSKVLNLKQRETKKFKETISEVYQTINANGLDAKDNITDPCRNPVALLRFESTKKALFKRVLDDCQQIIDTQYQATFASVSKTLSQEVSRSTQLNKDIALINVKETIKWGVSDNGTRSLNHRGLVMNVSIDGQEYSFTRSLGISPTDMSFVYDGKFGVPYSDTLVSLMNIAFR